MKKKLLTESKLRYLLREALLLLEGFKQDKEELLVLVQDDPSMSEKVSNFKPPAIRWLIQRYGENAKIEEPHPIADSILTLEKYISKMPQIKARWQRRDKKDYGGKSWGEILALSYEQSKMNPSWKKPPYDWVNVNSWTQSPMDWGKMSSDEMSQIMTLSDLKKSKNTVREEDPPGIFVKKVGPWNIWLPETKSDSIRIAGFDPVTMTSHVAWCTARTSGSNLFYTYNTTGKYLIYVIRDNPRPAPDPAGRWDYISIGVKDGQIIQPAGFAGATVDRENNKGLQGDFWSGMKNATGPHYTEIKKVVNDIVNKYQDSPAVNYQLMSLQDPRAIRHVLGSLGFSEKITEVIRLVELASDKNVVIAPEVKSTIIKLLKIKTPAGEYNYKKFESLNKGIQIISYFDPEHFKSVAALESLFSFAAKANVYAYGTSNFGPQASLLIDFIIASDLPSRGAEPVLASKLAKLQEVYQILEINPQIFGQEGTQLILAKIDSVKSNFEDFANFVEELRSIKSVADAVNAFKTGRGVVSKLGTLDKVFLDNLDHEYMPASIINRNITDHRIKDNLLSLTDVERLLREASTSKQSALSFLRKFKKLSDVALVATQSTESAKLYRGLMLSSFDLMTSREIFEVIEKTSGQIEDAYSEVFESSVRALKSDQPEKFREVAEKVKNMVFPPKIISNAFSVETESMSDFVDNLFDDADDSIDDLLADLGVDDIQF